MSKSEFEKLLNQATSAGNLEQDWEATLTLCDMLRRKDKGTIKAKEAVSLIKKKILDKSNAVSLHGLCVIETCMKNCGTAFHREVLDRTFLDDLHDLAKTGHSGQIKEKIVELVGAWEAALGSESDFKAIRELHAIMKVEGFNFPPLKDTDLYMDSEAAPDWVEDSASKHCHMCRKSLSSFSISNRRHHCRNCGNIFCGQCSSKKVRIPKFGFTDQEVRVCDFCHRKLSGDSSASAANESDLSSEYLRSSLARETQERPSRNQTNEEELKRQEEEELQIAMALSLSEEESKAAKPSTNYAAPPASAPPQTSYYTPPAPAQAVREPDPPSYVPPPAARDPELTRYEDREYWERRRAQQQEHEYEMPQVSQLSQVARDSSGGNGGASGAVAMATALPPSPEAGMNEEDENGDYRTLVESMRNTIDMFCSRMQTVHGLGRSIALDSSVQTLFHSLNAMHPQLLKHTEDQNQLKDHYESLQKKLLSVKEARASLNSMRRAYQKKQRQLEEEREMLARLQVQQKLELMRQQRREEEDHQEMLRQRRQKEIDEQLKLQELENQQRLIQHQQRQLQLHLSVQAEQQSHLNSYAPDPSSQLNSYDPSSQYEAAESMTYAPQQSGPPQSNYTSGYHQAGFMSNQQVDPASYYAANPSVSLQQQPQQTGFSNPSVTLQPPQQSAFSTSPASQQPAVYSTLASSLQQPQQAAYSTSSLQPSLHGQSTSLQQPQYQQQLQPMDSLTSGYSPPMQRHEASSQLQPQESSYYAPEFQSQFQSLQPQLQSQQGVFPVAPLQTGHPPQPVVKPEPQLISFD